MKGRQILTLCILCLFSPLQALCGTAQYSYDDLNRLIKVDYGDGSTIEYTYDAAGNRLSETVVKANTAPATPSTPSPANGAVNVALQADLSWKGGDPDAGDTVTYDVYLGKANPPGTKVSSGQSATKWDPGALTAGSTYYWKIVARDQKSAQTEGPVWHFATAVLQADLGVAMTDSPNSVNVGSNLTYTVTVSNAGPNGATGVVLTDTLPSGAVFVSATPSQGKCSQAAGTVTCTLGNLAKAGSAAAKIIVKPGRVGTITNKVRVVGTETDPRGANNTAELNSTVQNPSAILVVSPNGGQSWKAGTTQSIRWSYTGKPGASVKLQLLKSGKVVKMISASTPIGTGGAGSFSWKIPATQTQGTDYKIKVTSTANLAYTDSSNGNFTITR